MQRKFKEFDVKIKLNIVIKDLIRFLFKGNISESAMWEVRYPDGVDHFCFDGLTPSQWIRSCAVFQEVKTYVD